MMLKARKKILRLNIKAVICWGNLLKCQIKLYFKEMIKQLCNTLRSTFSSREVQFDVPSPSIFQTQSGTSNLAGMCQNFPFESSVKCTNKIEYSQKYIYVQEKLLYFKNTLRALGNWTEVWQHASLYTMSILKMQSGMPRELESSWTLTNQIIPGGRELIYCQTVQTKVHCTIPEMKKIAAIASKNVRRNKVAFHHKYLSQQEASLATESLKTYFYDSKSASKLFWDPRYCQLLKYFLLKEEFEKFKVRKPGCVCRTFFAKGKRRQQTIEQNSCRNCHDWDWSFKGVSFAIYFVKNGKLSNENSLWFLSETDQADQRRRRL